MRAIATLLIILFTATSASSSEYWACNGFKSTNDGSESKPFLLKGTKSRYEYKFLVEKQIKFIAENDVDNYLIYVDDTSNTYKHAYYLKFSGYKLVMTKFTNDGYNFITTCYRQ